MAGELLNLDPDDAAKLTLAINETIAASYIVDKSTPTAKETRRRFNICLGWYRKLLRDYDYALTRICDELPQALRHSLDNTGYDPGGRGSWSTSGSKLYIPK